MSTYTIHIKDKDTGIVMEWQGMSQHALDWLTEEQRPPTEVVQVFGFPTSTFWEPEPAPNLDQDTCEDY